jgi:hypothetical protein
MQNIAAYLSTLKRLHVRLLMEGYRVVDGEVIHPRQDDKTESES